MTPADIRAARIKLGLTQDELAAALGLTSGAVISRAERGVSTLGKPAKLLILVYLDGYRPANWPKPTEMVGWRSAALGCDTR